MPAKKASKKTDKKKTQAAKRKKKDAKPLFTLHLVSDETGSLAGHMINAVLTQFPDIRIKEVYHIFKRDKADIEKTVESFKRGNHIVFYALLDPESKHAIRNACVKSRIPHFDLVGSLVQFISDHTGTLPVNELSRLHETDAGYFQRIDAMEFTAQHDDSRRLESISQADLVIVGLSRVSKSPTSFYLGFMGYKVANVSITRETGFPSALKKIRAKKIVAFTATPRVICETRQRRFEAFEKEIERKHAGELPYYDRRSVVEEVVWSEKEYKKRGYPMLDNTDFTVEQAAARVLKTLGAKRKHIDYR